MRLIHIDEQTERAYLKKHFEGKTITTNQLIHLIYKYGWLRHSLLVCLGENLSSNHTFKIEAVKCTKPKHNGLKVYHLPNKEMGEPVKNFV